MYFATFGVPDKISTDGGPEFTAFATQQFLKTWGVEHRVSSAYFPQSNGRAVVAVKATKRLLIANVSPRGDLNNDLFLQALLELRNTPDCDMFAAKIVFGQPLRGAFSFFNRLPMFTNRSIRRTWREAWRAKKDALRLRAGRNNAALRANSRPLYVPCIVVTTCSSKSKLATTLVNGIKLVQSTRLWDSISMLSRWVDWDASLNVIEGSSVSSHTWCMTPH